MIRNYYLMSGIFGISTCFLTGIVAHEVIVGGAIALHASSFPHQVSVQFPGHGHVCGGGIIGDRFILTAAHCILNGNRHLRSTQIFILAGTVNLNYTGPPAINVRVETVFFPAEFHPSVEFSYGDIAVLQLAKSLSLGHQMSVKALELPRNYDHVSRATIAGFGWSKCDNGVGHIDGYYRYAQTSVLPNNDCMQRYPREAIESDIHLCAEIVRRVPFTRYTGVCHGDTGSPLVVSRTIAIGILSRVPANCDEQGEVAVYTRVAHYSKMILNVMEHSHDPQMISLHT